MKNITQSYIDMSNIENMVPSSHNLINTADSKTTIKDSYYTELGFKINKFRVSVRIPTSTKASSSSTKPITSYYSVTKRSCISKSEKKNGVIDVTDKDWEWRPSPKSSPNSSPKVFKTSTPLRSTQSTSSLSSSSLAPYDVKIYDFESPIHRTLKEPKSIEKKKSEKCLIGIPVAPPLPPRSKSPSTPPLSAQPPYPSSTVQRKRNNSNPTNKFVLDDKNGSRHCAPKRHYSYV